LVALDILTLGLKASGFLLWMAFLASWTWAMQFWSLKQSLQLHFALQNKPSAKQGQ
jgi:hypothetical protein